MSFNKMNLIEPLQKALANEGYTIPTPIQEQSIPVILERKDLLGCAQTGSGKTAAFAIPILQILNEDKAPPKSRRVVKSLILTPTRELAVQIGDSFNAYGKFTGLRNAVIYGGVSQRMQTDKLRNGVDILIATPGRLLDLMNQNYINLSSVKVFVLDEADRMLDMGFITDIKKIIAKMPVEKQTLFFSATMPPEIKKLSGSILNNPVRIDITPESTTVETITQSVYFVSRPDKKKLLIHLLKNESVMSALVFTRTKRGADVVSQFLNDAKIHSDSIHGDKTQGARQRALNRFKARQTRVLVATDIAARGIDIDKLSHVFNFDIPDFSETYIHRIGRTGRAGLSGTAVSFCDAEEKSYLRDINRLIKTPIPVIEDHPYHVNLGVIDRAESGSVRSFRKPSGNGRRTGRSSGSGKSGGSFNFSRDTKKKWVRKSHTKKSA